MSVNDNSSSLRDQLRQILNPTLLLKVYHLKSPWPKSQSPSGSAVGWYNFRPSRSYLVEFYDLVYHSALLPLSKIPLTKLLEVDLMTTVLPSHTAEDYPEQCLGLLTLLDQARIILTKGYACRYMRAFFDPVCEKLALQLISLPVEMRPDVKTAWLSRGYSMEDWLARTIWFWTPLVHSDMFMIDHKQRLKEWLGEMRQEIERFSGRKDPLKKFEEEDERDLNAFQRIENEGPSQKPLDDVSGNDDGRNGGSREADMADYAFWWWRIINSHFVITDTCGHYPYWIRKRGGEWNDQDREFMKVTNNYRYDPAEEPVLELIREDSLADKWRPLEMDRPEQ